MQLSFTEKKKIRKSFGKLKESLSIPNLIEVQKNSYKELTEYNTDPNINLIIPLPREKTIHKKSDALNAISDKSLEALIKMKKDVANKCVNFSNTP